MRKFSDNSSQILNIWDSDLPLQDLSVPTVLWRRFVEKYEPELTISISDVVEENDFVIRKQLLEFIYNTGNAITTGKRTSHKFRNNFDYFWMTQFHSRPYTQTAEMNNLAKVFALFEIIKANNIRQIEIYTNNKKLIKVIKSFRNSLQLKVIVTKSKSPRQKKSSRTKIKSILPRPLLAALAMVTQLKNSLALRAKNSLKDNATISFFDYWYRLSPHEKKFGSQYWTKLVDQLDQEVNWFHNLVDQHKVSELQSAAELCSDFNFHKKQSHQIIDAKINLRILIHTLFDHSKLVLSSFPSRKYSSAFIDPLTKIDFWPILRSEWLNSHRGYESLINCLRFNRLENLISKMKPQRVGFYLMENQPWEMALIYLWKKYQHGKIIGVAHSTIRFWDLRLMSDARRFTDNDMMPRPNFVLVNGPLANKSLIESGYRREEVIEAEALMYLHLDGPPLNRPTNSVTTVLVATDYLESATTAQMNLLEEVVHRSPNRFRILIKPHWSQNFSKLSFTSEVVSGKQDIANYFDQVDVLYCSAITSAAIDGVCSGLPVIQCLDPMSFNLSPLKGHAAVITVRTSEELQDALEKSGDVKNRVHAHELFNLDKSLTKWMQLLQA